MHKKRILHIIKSLGRGGAEVLLPETLKLHDRNDFEFHYIYFLPWKNQMVEAIETAGGKVVCFSASNNVGLLLQYNKVIHYCKINNIDLIHCHLPWSGFLGRLVFLNTKIPVIYTEHNIQERYHKATKFLNKLSFNFQSLALGVSEDVSRSIKDNIYPQIPVRTLLNGVNTKYFQRNIEKGKAIKRELGIPENATVIGNIAVLREQKCIPIWLKAFAKINKDKPGVFGILVGTGPMEEEIKQIVIEMNLLDKVKLAGLQTDTVSYFSAMDVFMMSSAFEGLPIALLEAMSMKCAIVSTKAGGVVEAVTDEREGLLCEVGDWKCLADKVKILIEDNEKRSELQIAARKRVKKFFSLAVMVENLEEIYTRILTRKN